MRRGQADCQLALCSQRLIYAISSALLPLLRRGLFYVCLDWTYHPGAPAVVGLVRLYTYKAGEFLLVDVPLEEARRKAKELRKEGRVITHTEQV